MHQTLNEMSKLAKEMARAEHEAMVACQGFNAQGYKRLHRLGSKKYHHINLLIDNYMLDNSMKLDNEPITSKYVPSSFKNHMETYFSKMERFMERLNALNAQIVAKTGIPFCYGKDIFDCLYYHIHKYRRSMQIFNDVNWSAQVIYWWDKKLHDKLKKKEGEENS